MAEPKDKGKGIAGIEGSGYHLIQPDPDATQKIDALIAPIRDLGLNMPDFTVEDINAIGLTMQGFTKMAHIFKSYSEPDVLEKLLIGAICENVLTSLRKITLKEFIGLCKWLRKPAGQRVSQNIQRAIKIERKVGKSENIQGVAYSQIPQVVLQDMSAEAKTIRTQHEAAITALHQEIKMHEVSMQAELDGLRVKYGSPADYANPPVHEMGQQCYDLCVCDTEMRGGRPMPRTDYGIKLAMEKFENLVHLNHQIKFCENETVQNSLKEYLTKKIQGCEDRFELKAAQTLRAYLAAVGAAQVTSAPPAPADVPGTDGASQDPPAAQVVDEESKTDSTAADLVTAGEKARGGKGQARGRKVGGSGVSRKKQGADDDESQGARVLRTRKGADSANK